MKSSFHYKYIAVSNKVLNSSNQRLSERNNAWRSCSCECNRDHFNFILFNKVIILIIHVVIASIPCVILIQSILYSLREVGELFTQLFVLLFAIINTSMAKSPLVLALVFMVALYYWVYVLVKILQLQIRSLLIIGSVVFILALMNISPTIAWIDFGLLILIFSLMGYKNRKELYQMIPQRIKNSIEGNNDMSNSTAELGTTTR